MQVLIIILAAAAGLLIGFVAASQLASKARALLTDTLRSEKDNALKDSNEQIGTLKKQVKQLETSNKKSEKNSSKGQNKKDDSKKKLAKLEKEIQTLTASKKKSEVAIKKASEEHVAAVKSLEDELSETKSAVEEIKASSDTKVHEETISKLQQELDDSQTSFKDIKKENAVLLKTIDKLESTEKETVSKKDIESEDLRDLQDDLKDAGKGLNTILTALLKSQGQKAALLADSSGIAIASAGDSDTIDNVAAASSTLTGIPKSLNKVLPLNQHYSFQFQDGTNAISGQTFESAGELIAITTFGKVAPSPKAMSHTLNSITTALE